MIHKTEATITKIPDGVGRKIDHIACKGGKLMTKVQYSGSDFQISALVPFTGEAELDRAPIPRLESGLPKIKWDSDKGGVVQCYNYFAAVYQKLSSEAFVWWHWDTATKQYVLVVPSFYYASGGSLHYEISTHFCARCQVGLMDGIDHCPHCGDEEDVRKLNILGTSHSHGSMAAFHSATDHANELNTTGFHITFGHMQNGPTIGIAGSFVVAEASHRFDTSWSDHFEYDATELSAWRLSLWLDLVASSSAMEGNFQVFDSKDRIVFAGTKELCDRWVIQLKPYSKEVYSLRKKVSPATLFTGKSKSTWSWDGTKSANRSTAMDHHVTSAYVPTGVDEGAGETFIEILKMAPDYILIDAALSVFANVLAELHGGEVDEYLLGMGDMMPNDASWAEVNRLVTKNKKSWLTVATDKALSASAGIDSREVYAWIADLTTEAFDETDMSASLTRLYEQALYDCIPDTKNDESDEVVALKDSEMDDADMERHWREWENHSGGGSW